MKRSSTTAGTSGSENMNKIRKTVVDEFNEKAEKFKPILKLTEIELNKEYPITGCRRCTTMFRPRIRLDLNECVAFFSERFASMSETTIKELNSDSGFIFYKDDNKEYHIKFKNKNVWAIFMSKNEIFSRILRFIFIPYPFLGI